MTPTRTFSFARRLLHRLLVVAGSVALTAVFFLVLPFIQAINRPPQTTHLVQAVDTANIPPPPAPLEEEPEDEPEPEEEPPELEEETPPLDLSQLELALDPGFGDGWGAPGFDLSLKTLGPGGDEGPGGIFSMTELDQEPRAIYKPGPILDAKLRKKAPGTVYIVFVVDPDGRVTDAVVQKSTDPVFEPAALAAVKKWKFEPGRRNGQPVRFRMRLPMTFPEQ